MRGLKVKAHFAFLFERPLSGALVLYQPWEFCSIPAEWVPHLTSGDPGAVDELWVPSEEVKECYAAAGATVPIWVLHHGIPKDYNPNTPSSGALLLPFACIQSSTPYA